MYYLLLLYYDQCLGLRSNGRIYVCKKCPMRRDSGTRT